MKNFRKSTRKVSGKWLVNWWINESFPCRSQKSRKNRVNFLQFFFFFAKKCKVEKLVWKISFSGFFECGLWIYWDFQFSVFRFFSEFQKFRKNRIFRGYVKAIELNTENWSKNSKSHSNLNSPIKVTRERWLVKNSRKIFQKKKKKIEKSKKSEKIEQFEWKWIKNHQMG